MVGLVVCYGLYLILRQLDSDDWKIVGVIATLVVIVFAVAWAVDVVHKHYNHH